jgi:hypothetical protein
MLRAVGVSVGERNEQEEWSVDFEALPSLMQ